MSVSGGRTYRPDRDRRAAKRHGEDVRAATAPPGPSREPRTTVSGTHGDPRFPRSYGLRDLQGPSLPSEPRSRCARETPPPIRAWPSESPQDPRVDRSDLSRTLDGPRSASGSFPMFFARQPSSGGPSTGASGAPSSAPPSSVPPRFFSATKKLSTSAPSFGNASVIRAWS